MGGVAVASLLVVGTVACASDPTGPTGDYDELCVDKLTSERVPDEECDDPNHPHRGRSHLVYLPYQHGVANPAYPVGSRVVGGTTVKPSSGNFVRGGLGGFRGGGG
jgi:hypothetical protein